MMMHHESDTPDPPAEAQPAYEAYLAMTQTKHAYFSFRPSWIKNKRTVTR